MARLLVLAALGLLLAAPSAPARQSAAALQLHVTATPAHVRANGLLTYSIAVTNTGDAAAGPFSVVTFHEWYPADERGRFYPPEAVSISPSEGSCVIRRVAPALTVCSLPGLAPGAALAIRSVERVRAPDGPCHTLRTGPCSVEAVVDLPEQTGARQVVVTPVVSAPAPRPSPSPSPVTTPTAAPTGGAAPGRHGGKIALGVLGSPSRFQAQTGQRSLSRLLIVGWGQGASSGSSFVQLLATMGELPILGLNSEGAISPLQIARGAGDGYLVAMSRALHDWARPVYVRPLAEMNGHWNSYCAYDASGRPRGPDRSTAAFRKAFARIYLIVHGGSDVNAKLARLGLPPVRVRLDANPLVRVIWNPQGYGSPDLPGNSAAAYYPGDRYADVVGDDLYDIGGRPQWASAEALYQAHPNKPFAFPEWGLWGIDEPSFVGQMAAFVRTHRRVELISYYAGRPGSIFDLASKPASRAEYKRVIVPLGR
jgi:hypothetical protein